MTAPTLNDTQRRYPRTLRETRHDPLDWWEHATAASAEEQRLGAVFAGLGRRRTEHARSHAWAQACIYVIAAGVLLALIGGWL